MNQPDICCENCGHSLGRHEPWESLRPGMCMATDCGCWHFTAATERAGLASAQRRAE